VAQVEVSSVLNPTPLTKAAGKPTTPAMAAGIERALVLIQVAARLD
jgi:hypothetical protein